MSTDTPTKPKEANTMMGMLIGCYFNEPYIAGLVDAFSNSLS